MRGFPKTLEDANFHDDCQGRLCLDAEETTEFLYAVTAGILAGQLLDPLVDLS